MNQAPKVYVVVTAFNEAKYLATFLRKLGRQELSFLVIDDGSTDQTASIARRYTKHVLSHPVNLGKGATMKTGAEFAFKHLGADAVIFMDGDDQHSPTDLKHFFAKLHPASQQAQLVLGVRSFDAMPKTRVFGNQLASALVKLLFGRYIPDIPSGFKALNRIAYQKLKWQSSDYGVELEIACKVAKLGLAFQTVAVQTLYHDLDRGMNLLDSFKIVYKILLWRINL